MKRTIITLAVLLSLGVSCTQKESLNNTAAGNFPISVKMPGTKVAVGEKDGDVYPLSWEAGDRLLVNLGIETDGLDAAYDGASEALFTTASEVNYPATLVYPADVKCTGNCILIPAEQQYSEGRLAGGCGVLVAYAPNTKNPATMQHACGYFRVPVTGSATIESASLEALGGEYVAGRFSVNPMTAALTHVESPSTSIESSSRITVSVNEALVSAPKVLYFAVPAGNYAKGFRVVLKDTEGKAMVREMYTASGKTVVAGIVTEMPELQYVPGTAADDEFTLSESSMIFPPIGYEASSVTVNSCGEALNVTSEGLGWLDFNLPETIPAGRTLTISAVPAGGNVSEVKEGTITFKGAVSGIEKTVTVSQSKMPSNVDGYPALWEISASKTCVTDGVPNEYGKTWTKYGVASPAEGPAAGKAFISTGSNSGRKLTYSLDASSSTKTLCVGGMGEGDWIMFSVPATSIPAGTDFDFMLTLNATTTAAPKYFIFEYWDGGEWKHDPTRLYTAEEDSNVKYSFYIKHFSSANHRTFIQSFTLQNAVSDDFVKMRIRAVGNINGAGKALVPTSNAYVYFATLTYQACNIVCYKDAPAVTDRTKLLQLGNSFTYYFGSAFKLKEMCRRGGHQTDVRINIKGSQEFEHHMNTLVFSQEVVSEGGYDKVILQDGSYFHAEYAKGTKDCIVGVTPKYSPSEILELTKQMTRTVRNYSPDADIVLESVWSYSRKAAGDNYLGFGSYANFDYYQWLGSTSIASQCDGINWLSPIGKAFANARNNYGFTSEYNYLNHTDNYHDSREGAYLKACVNYLILFGDGFGAGAPDCDLPSDVAAKLRQAATDIVMASREDFHIR